MKRWLTILFLILTLFCGIAQAVSEEHYNWIPKKNVYFISRTESIVIRFLTWDQWEIVIKKELNETATRVMGLTITTTYQNGNKVYEIYIPYKPDGSINLDTLGHEFAHVLDGHWHK